MPVFLAFLAGSIFTVAVSKSTRNNLKTANKDLNDVLDNRRELIEKVNEILEQKEKNGEIIIKRIS